MKELLNRFKNIHSTTLLTHVIITMIYPAAKAIRAEENKTIVFLDTLTIVAMLLIIVGVFYRLVLKGDFDRVQYVFNRSLRPQKPFDAYEQDRTEERRTAFNYPLWLGIFYFAACALIGFLR